MSINAVNSAASASVWPVRQADLPQATRMQEALKTAGEAINVRPGQEKRDGQAPDPVKPVINALGQTTGRLINTSA